MKRRSPEFFLGRTAGSYRLQHVLGSGGFATTFLGYKEANPTPYAVKVFDQSSGIAEVTAFLQEAFVLAQLKHPNIVPVYQVGALPVVHEEEGKQKFTEHYPYFVMKYANQGDVRRLKPKQSSTPLSPEKVLDILSQAANGLYAGHTAEIPYIHRDIKPENLLSHENPDTGHVDILVADWGIVTIAHTLHSLQFDEQHIQGTPPYMAPEQFKGKAVKATDQYSLGITAYELYTGGLPFEGQYTFLQWANIHQNETPQGLYEKLKEAGQELHWNIWKAVLENVQPVIFQALEKEPTRRFDNTHLFAEMLREAHTIGMEVQQKNRQTFPQQRQETHPTRSLEADFIVWGDALFDQKNYEEALRAYNRAIRLNPQSSDVYSKKGSLLCKLGKYTEAIAALDQAIKLNPNDSQAYNSKGYALSENDLLSFLFVPNDRLWIHEEALVAIEQAIVLNPQYREAYINKGDVLKKIGRYEEALVAIEQAIVLNPNDSTAYISKAHVFEKSDRYEEALVAIEQAIKLNPQDSYAYFAKGNALKHIGRYEEALVAIEQAIKLNPQDSYAYISKGDVQKNIGRYEEALVAYDQAIMLDPQFGRGYFEKINLLEQIGRYGEALAAIEQKIKRFPDEKNDYVRKGYVLKYLGRYEEALVAIEQAIMLDPQYCYAYISKASVLVSNGRYKEALAALDLAIKLDTEFGEGYHAYMDKANILKYLGRYEEALAVLDLAIKLHPKFGVAYCNKGGMLSEFGRHEEALEVYDQAIEIYPQNSDAHAGKGAVLCKLGRKKEAITSFNLAMESNPSKEIVNFIIKIKEKYKLL